MNDNFYVWINDVPGVGPSIIGVLLAGGHVPLVFASERVARAPVIRAVVTEHVGVHGLSARLLRFTAGEVVDQIEFAP